MVNEIELLFSKINEISYPNTMKIIKGEIKGRAFFPGGRGLFNDDDNSISDKQIMILGQDFDCETNHNISLQAGAENIEKNPTWKNLLCLLNEVNILPDNCFFTNAILGIRLGNKGTGKSPAFRDRAFINNCQNFLLAQLVVQKPKAIFVLGKETARFLASMTERLECWKHIKNFQTIDNAGHQIKKDVIFSNGVKTSLVLLTHPSFRPSNIKRRKFENSIEGNDAEIAMISKMLSTY